jgi:serine/threonine protein kinase
MAVQEESCTEDYVHFGEQRVRDFLVDRLRGKGRSVLLMNCCVPATPNALEVDLTLINGQGVFVIEVKDLYGPIRMYDDRWERQDGSEQPNPVAGIEHKARVVHGLLRRERIGWDRVNVAGLVVLAKNNSISGDCRKVYLLDDALIDALAKGKGLVGRNKITLSPSTIKNVRKVLHDARPPGQKQCVAGYPVLGSRNRGHYVDMEASDPEFEGRRVRIKQYNLPEIKSRRQLEKARLMFKRDMAALLEAGRHPHLLIPYRFYRDPSSDHRYYLVIEWVDGQTLSERIRAGPIPLPEQVSILKDVSEALIHCHSQHVIHRNLTPEAIYLTASGQVKVGDFDFARMSPVTHTLSSTGMLKIDTLYASPEVVYNIHDVDERADVYSLGAVWYDMLIDLSSESPLERARIDETALPEQAKELLRAMLAEKRDGRPASVGKVRRALERILPQEPAAAEVETP